MGDTMDSGSEPERAEDTFRKLDKLLVELRPTASEPAPKKRFGSSASDSQGKFNVALVDALAETLSALRATAATQETRLETIAQEMSEVRATSENLDAFRERSDRLETELRSAAANIRALQERAAALETALAQSRDEQAERVQHLLDEQRVCIRQLALQASEEAVLADRARRATELKLDELARRLTPPPA
jgi:chromosome segregation ATPase